MHPPLQAFLLWAEQQNIKISPHVEITYDNVTEDYSVKSNADAAVTPPEGRTGGLCAPYLHQAQCI